MKIYIFSPNYDSIFNKEAKNKLNSLGEVRVETKIQNIVNIDTLKLDEDKILAIDPDFFDWKFPSEAFKSISNIKAICLQTTSFSWLDVSKASEKDIPVINIRNFSTEAVAEWAMMMAMNTFRKVPLLIKEGFKEDFSKYQGLELKGKKVGIIGLGNIGSRIAELCTNLGMEVSYWSRNARNENYKFEELNEIFKNSDIIFPTVAQNSDTSNLITDNMLKSMKKQSIFVSIIHNVYNHELLLELVKENKIFGYAFEDAPGQFQKYEGNIWAAPALAWCTEESMQRNAKGWLKNIEDATKGIYTNRVN